MRFFRTRSYPAIQFALLLSSLLMFAATAQAAGQASTPPKQEQQSSDYVGSEVCKGCHEDVYNHMQTTAHSRMGFLPKATEKGVHCESCHGPGAAHVAGGGDVSKIRRFEKLSMTEANKVCLSCHATNLEIRHGERSPHSSNDVSCLSCHSPHHGLESAKLLIKPQPQLCYGCHATQKAEFSRPFRHRVNEGLIQCTDCHNPHGTSLGRAVRTSIGDQQVCYKCHTDKQGPFTFEHVPVRTEGCTSCHTPHGSTNPRLLRVYPVNLLCFQCHTTTMNNNVPGVPSFHNQSQKYQACTLCHTRIHGSNFDKFFFK